MDGWPTATTWTPISALAARFAANVAALATRDKPLADRIVSHSSKNTYHISAFGDTIRLGAGSPGSVQPLPNPVPPAAAKQLINQLSTGKQLTGPLLVAGLDHGWLWDALAKLEVKVAAAPGHRPPIYFLAPDLERLWLVLHVHDWRVMLADRRCIIFAGRDTAGQLLQFMADHTEIPWPRIAITTDDNVWPAGQSLDTLLATADGQLHTLLDATSVRIAENASRSEDACAVAETIRAGKPLRILGITSLYTTFLQHSMRDWLSGMQSLGHSTRLLIEQHDHEKLHPSSYLSAIADFRPDLILLIDHYRAEFPRMPAHIPCVMWVQDRLPNIFRAIAGEAQGSLDYTIGYGRRDCVTDFSYPRARFMESPVGVNEARFAAGVSADELLRHKSQIAFVSHASASAEQLVAEQIEKNSGEDARRLFHGLYERLAAVYARGEYITQEKYLHEIVDDSIRAAKVTVVGVQPLIDFTTQKLNNALFRHQALHWIADAGFELVLYGNGWENHPRFARFARGPADNQRALATIYRAADINLQMTPFGSAHQRLFEGLCAGGFFLLKKVTGDDVEPIYIELWDFCRAQHITDTDDFRRRASPRVHNLLQTIEGLTGEHPLQQKCDFVDGLGALAQAGFIRTSSTLWPEFERVAFSTREQLLGQLDHYLKNPHERAAVGKSMHARVLETVTYRGISQRMLNFIADDLANRNVARECEAAA